MATLPRYETDFFEALRQGARQSAEVIVPLVVDWLRPSRVVDLGCGDGTWLAVFQACGVQDIVGIDGRYVDPDILQIATDYFVPRDLSQPVSLERVFDLAISLEVAEHLPAASASGFIASLVKLSNVVLFSAAIPHQGGKHHINEQWPSYWATLFQAHGYVAVDALREKIWEHPAVEPWYAQNCLLFVRSDRLTDYPALAAKSYSRSQSPRSLIHPTIYLQHCPTDTSEAGDDAANGSSDAEPYLLVQPELPLTIEILNVSLSPAAEIISGASLSIEIEYRVNLPIETARFSLSLSNAAGEILIDTDTLVTLSPDDAMPSQLQLTFERLDLVAGDYFINPGIFAADWSRTYDYRWHDYPFQIRCATPQKGLLSPPVSWHPSVEPS
ncbi:MAG: methyltransferase domain-containing protein [Cyanobacteria bacterium P01_H01_bin.105]